MSVTKPSAPRKYSTEAVALFSYVFSMSIVFAGFVVQEIVLLACNSHLGAKPGPLWDYFSMQALLIIVFVKMIFGLLGVVALSAPLALTIWATGRLRMTSLPSYAIAGLLAAVVAACGLEAVDNFTLGDGQTALENRLGWPVWKMMLPALCGSLAYWHTVRSLSR
jgi:hypothetical protein